MDDKKLYEALDGLFACDMGATDSGICDANLKEEVIQYLKVLAEAELKTKISKFIQEHFLSNEASDSGYSDEDVSEFIEWLSEEMDVDITL